MAASQLKVREHLTRQRALDLADDLIADLRSELPLGIAVPD